VLTITPRFAVRIAGITSLEEGERERNGRRPKTKRVSESQTHVAGAPGCGLLSGHSAQSASRRRHPFRSKSPSLLQSSHLAMRQGAVTLSSMVCAHAASLVPSAVPFFTCQEERERERERGECVELKD